MNPKLSKILRSSSRCSRINHQNSILSEELTCKRLKNVLCVNICTHAACVHYMCSASWKSPVRRAARTCPGGRDPTRRRLSCCLNFFPRLCQFVWPGSHGTRLVSVQSALRHGVQRALSCAILFWSARRALADLKTASFSAGVHRRTYTCTFM